MLEPDDDQPKVACHLLLCEDILLLRLASHFPSINMTGRPAIDSAACHVSLSLLALAAFSRILKKMAERCQKLPLCNTSANIKYKACCDLVRSCFQLCWTVALPAHLQADCLLINACTNNTQW